MLSFTQNCPAAIVYDTFGASASFDSNSGATVAGPDFVDVLGSPAPAALAEQFFIGLSSPNYYLDTISFAVLGSPASPITATVTVYNDNGFDVPDLSLGIPFAQVAVVLPLNLSNTAAIVTADFNAGGIFADVGLLSAGSTYWVAISTTGTNQFSWADTTDATLEGFQGFNDNSGAGWTTMFRDVNGFFPLAAYSVSGSVAAVPEPSSVVMLGLAALPICIRRLRKKSSLTKS